jgi:hypothetical protein
MAGKAPRSPQVDSILRPHERSTDPHPQYIKEADLPALVAPLIPAPSTPGGSQPTDPASNAGLAAETAARIAGDASLSTAISNEASSRAAQDAILLARINDHEGQTTDAHGGIVGRDPGTGAATRIAVWDAPDQLGGDPALTWVAAGAPLDPVTVTSVTRFNDAVVTSPTEVRLTPDSTNKTGAIFHENKIRTDQNWSITFEFRITGTTPNGDGIYVRLFPDGLNFGTNTITGASAAVGVEIDTLLTPALSDPAVPHIAIHGTLTLDHADPLFVASVGEASVTDGNWHTMVVSFDAANNEISVTYDATPVVSGTLNVGAVVGPAAYIGLVGFNGGGGSRIHDVRNWSITGVYEGGQLARADIDGRLFVTEAPTEDIEVVRKLELDAEESARIAADGVLQANIDAEESARIAADDALDLRIDGKQPYQGIGNRDDLSLSYDPATRRVTITGAASVWIDGVESIKTNPFVFDAHPNTYGGWFFYFDEDNLPVVGSTPWDLTLHAPVAYVLYNPTITDGVAFYELHEAWRDPAMHVRLHFVDGTSVISDSSTFLATGFVLNSDANVDKTFGIGSGEVMDEDIRFTCSAMADGGPYCIFRRTGASGEWTWTEAETFPFLDDGTNIQYNEFTGATWQMTALSGTQFVNMWVFATTALAAVNQIFLVVGQRVWASQAEAEAESVANIDWGGVPFQEIAPLYQVTYRRAAPNGNQGKADIRRVARLAGSRNTIAVAGTTPTVASAVSFVPAGDIAATNVQLAIEELDAEKLAIANLVVDGGDPSDSYIPSAFDVDGGTL